MKGYYNPEVTDYKTVVGIEVQSPLFLCGEKIAFLNQPSSCHHSLFLFRTSPASQSWDHKEKWEFKVKEQPQICRLLELRVQKEVSQKCKGWPEEWQHVAEVNKNGGVNNPNKRSEFVLGGETHHSSHFSLSRLQCNFSTRNKDLVKKKSTPLSKPQNNLTEVGI